MRDDAYDMDVLNEHRTGVNEPYESPDEPEPEFFVSEFLSSSVRLDIRRITLAAQCERLRELADALEHSRWRAEQLWEERCSELNALEEAN